MQQLKASLAQVDHLHQEILGIQQQLTEAMQQKAAGQTPDPAHLQFLQSRLQELMGRLAAGEGAGQQAAPPQQEPVVEQQPVVAQQTIPKAVGNTLKGFSEVVEAQRAMFQYAEATAKAIASESCGFVGTLERWTAEGGGVISCTETSQMYGCDVFVSKPLGLEVGDIVVFRAVEDDKQKPFATFARRLERITAQKTWLNNAEALLMLPPQEIEYKGYVAKMFSEPGFGFVQCPDTWQMYKRDIFLHSELFGDLRVGDAVLFTVALNSTGLPHCRTVKRIPAAKLEVTDPFPDRTDDAFTGAPALPRINADTTPMPKAPGMVEPSQTSPEAAMAAAMAAMNPTQLAQIAAGNGPQLPPVPPGVDPSLQAQMEAAQAGMMAALAQMQQAAVGAGLPTAPAPVNAIVPPGGGDSKTEALAALETMMSTAHLHPSQRFMPGDWHCPKCKDLQFARNTVCRKCGEPKPTDAFNSTAMHQQKPKIAQSLEGGADNFKNWSDSTSKEAKPADRDNRRGRQDSNDRQGRRGRSRSHSRGRRDGRGRR